MKFKKYNDILDNPKTGWSHADKNEMQKSGIKMICEKLCLRPKAVFDLFNKANIEVQHILYLLIPHNDFERCKTTSDIIFESVMSEDVTILQNYIKELK